MKAIETYYGGYKFRSRLEARWAVYFDCLGILWEYEKEGYSLDNGYLYLPDFWLPEVRMWAEVKGEDFTDTETKKAELLTVGSNKPCLLLSGIPSLIPYEAIWNVGKQISRDEFAIIKCECNRHFYFWEDCDAENEQALMNEAILLSREIRFEHRKNYGHYY